MNKLVITITADSVQRNVVIEGKTFKDKTIKIRDGRWETDGEGIEKQMEEFYSENEYDISDLIEAIRYGDSIDIMEAMNDLD